MPHTGLAVIESRWWSEGNDSVRPLFETLAGIVENNPHFVRYDMFCEEQSLSRIIKNLTSSEIIHSVYVGAHGDESSICGLGDAVISRTKLRNMFINSNKSKAISGLYFGSCQVANQSNADFWLNEKKTGLKWIAGYTKSVDWIDSSAVDMIFWSKYLHERKSNRSRKRNKKSDTEMVRSTSSEMKELMPTVFNQMGFNVYYLDHSKHVSTVW